MSQLWTFSPSSDSYLRRFITASLRIENDNKWTQKFGRNRFNETKTSISEDHSLIAAPIAIEIVPSPAESDKNDVNVSYGIFFESIESKVNLDIIANECSKNPELLMEMAKCLTANTVEKMFNEVFNAENVETSFLASLVLTFIPSYIKHQYTLLCIDLLIKINDLYPELFQKLLKIILNDIEVPNSVLNSFVSTLSEDSQTLFLESMTNIDLSSESFIHNILTIYCAYKDCKKTDTIQNYISFNIIQHGKICSSDRNYGRLFLTYLQAEKTSDRPVNVKDLEKCLELHMSQFKRPCAMILKEFDKN